MNLADQTPWVRADATYVIAGGAGSLGRDLAKHLLQYGARRIYLIGRSAEPASIADLRKSVCRNQSTLTYLEADVADRSALSGVFKSIRGERDNIRGVFHLAGVIQDQSMMSKSSASFDYVIAPKVEGLVNLDELTAEDPLDVFVAYSSMAALVGNPGQADYAYANGFMDHYMSLRERWVAEGSRHGRSLSLNWPLWSTGGMRPPNGVKPLQNHESGAVELDRDAGLAALDRAMSEVASQIAVFFGDVQKLDAWLSRPSSDPDRSHRREPTGTRAGPTDSEQLATQVRSLAKDFSAELSTYLCKIIAELLKFDISEVSDTQAVSELGLDSITFTTLADRLNADFDLSLNPAALFEIETISAFADMMIEKHPDQVAAVFGAGASDTNPEHTDFADGLTSIPDIATLPSAGDSDPFLRRAPEAQHHSAIAIVGAAGRFPAAPTLDAFWHVLSENVDAISEVPRERWQWSSYSSNSSGRWGGFISDIDQFDPLFFGISPREAAWMDPQQRILLETVWHAFEDAGLTQNALAKSDTGVFVGASSNDYGVLISDADVEMSPHRSTGLSHAVLPNRLSYIFGLSGPSEAIDTACSSSLVAINRAILSLRQGECRMAVAAGVNAMLSPDLYMSFSRAGMLSPSGRSHSFDAAADGYVRGEGVGAIILKPLSDALRDGDRVRAVIRGTAVNHVGHTSSLTVPSAGAQAALITAACRDAQIEITDLDYIEAHGTGTSLGDPIEINGILKALGEQGSDALPLHVGTAKANIGHLEASAGIAGVLKTMLAIENETVPGNPRLNTVNPYIEIDDTPIELVRETQAWPNRVSGRLRRAGVSSFGFGGTNAHIVLEEAPHVPLEPAHETGPFMFPVSARSPAALKGLLLELQRLVQKFDGALEDLSFNLCQRRSSFEYRHVVVAADVEELLTGIAAGVELAEASVPATPDTAEQNALAERYSMLLAGFAGRGDDERRAVLEEIAEVCASGAKSDWSALFVGPPRRFVDLPKYPFEKERYWFDGSAGLRTSDSTSVPITFGADDGIFSEHVVAGRPVMPAAAILDLANVHAPCAARARIIEDFCLMKPVRPGPNGIELCFTYTPVDKGTDLAVSVGSEIVAQARILPAPDLPAETIDRPEEPRSVLTGDEIYGTFGKLGISYGPQYRSLRSVARCLETVSGRLDRSNALISNTSVIDAAFQTLIGYRPSSPESPLAVPEAVKSVQIAGSLTDADWIIARPIDDSHTCFDLQILDSTDNPIASLLGVQLRELGTVSSPPAIYIENWQKAPEERASAISAATIVAADPMRLPKLMTTAKASGLDISATVPLIGNDEIDLTPIISSSLGSLRSFINDNTKSVRLLIDDTFDVSVAHVANLASLVLTVTQTLTAWPNICLDVVYAGKSSRAVHALVQSLKQDGLRADVRTLDRSDESEGEHLIAEALQSGSAQVRWVNDSREAKVLQRVDLQRTPSKTVPDGAVCLVTGGSGVIGRKLASHLLETCAARVVLVSRTANTELGELCAQWPDRVHAIHADISTRDGCQTAVDKAAAKFGAIDAVFHLAGSLNDMAYGQIRRDDLVMALASKCGGAIELLNALSKAPPKLLVAFSSAAAVFGNRGQVSYALANGAMADVLSNATDPGTRTLVVDWPLWRDGGMASERLAAAYSELGLVPIDAEGGFQAMAAMQNLEADRGLVVKFKASAPKHIEINGATTMSSVSGRRATPDERQKHSSDTLISYLCETVGAVLGLPAAKVKPTVPLERLGLDSALIMELTAALEADFGELPTTLFFEFQTVAELGDFLAAEKTKAVADLFEADTSNAVNDTGAIPELKPAPMDPSKLKTEPIAIIGLSAKFGDAPDLDRFWENLVAARDSVREIPERRWDVDDMFDPNRDQKGKSYSKWGSFLDDFDQFEPGFFRVSTRDAKLIDPQERLFLQETWRALEDAGYPPERLKRAVDAKVGVFVGAMWSEYQLHGRHSGAFEDRVSLGSSFASIANRTSFFLGLNGPSLSIDTMCSSSLSALHLACNAIRLGECRMGIVGGVNLSLHPNKYLQLSQSHFAASDGRCRSFGDGGDGYVPGEGVGAVLLRPLSDALAAGDRIQGVVLGSALNHGGAGTGYTVPNPTAQSDVISAALDRANVDPQTISYVEAHGTGTPLGDPIEIRGLSLAFGSTEKIRPIGSVKSNLGHLEAAAGIASLTKVLLQFKHKTLVPTLHADPPNPSIDFAAAGFNVQTEVAPWTPDNGGKNSLRASISSFGAGGSNAHVVLEQGVELGDRETPIDRRHLFPVSARTQSALIRKLEDLADWLEGPGAAEAALDVSYTLFHGRSHFDRRFVFLASTNSELASLVRDALSGTRNACVLSSEFIKKGDLAPADLDERTGSLLNAGRPFIEGDDFAGEDLFAPEQGRIVRMPGYPFETRRIWVDPPKNAGVAKKPFGNVIPESPIISREIQPNIRPMTPASDEEQGAMTPSHANNGDIEIHFVEETLRQILAQQLDEDPLTLPDGTPFGDLGVDSVHAVQIVRDLGEVLNAELSVDLLYNNPTIKRLSEAVSSTGPAPSADSAAPPPAPNRKTGATKTDSVAIEALIKNALATVLEDEPTSFESNLPFSDFGLDSVAAVQVARVLYEQGAQIKAPDLYDHPTIARLATYIADTSETNVALPRSEIDAPRSATSHPEPPRADRVIVEMRRDPAESGDAGPRNLQLKRKRHAHARRPGKVVLQAVTTADKVSEPVAVSDNQSPFSEANANAQSAVVLDLDYLDRVQFVPHFVPDPDADCVQIDVAASSISLSDIMRFRGVYPEMPKFPFVAGLEVSGRVAAIGPGVTEFSIGEPVIAMMSKSFGGHSSRANAHVSAVIRLPKGMSFEEGCTLPSSFLTAYHGLVTQADLQPGERVLIQSGASALGLMAIQIALAKGARVIATSSSEEKCEFLRSFGVADTINYTMTDFRAETMRLTDRGGVDVVLNMLSGEYIEAGINCLAEGGRYIEAALGSLRSAPPLNIGSVAENKSIMALGLRSYLWKHGSKKVREYHDVLRTMLAEQTLKPLPFTSFSPDGLDRAVAHILERKSIGKTLIAFPQSTTNADDVPRRQEAVPNAPKDLAIIGMSGRFPGAESTQDLWTLLEAGECTVGPDPEHRKSLGYGRQTWGGFVDDIDSFDPLFFDISPAEAEWMDPQQRLLLEEVWKALEDAGIVPSSLAGTDTGVFVGGRGGTYGETRNPSDRPEAQLHAFTGSLGSILAGRISYTLDLRGPATTVDTACSSALVAVDMAVRAVSSGECSLAIVAGVSIGTAPGLDPGEALYCRAFDDGANGFVIGEGVGVIVLKPTGAALSDNDRIRGLIKASHVNQDGLSNGLLAPNGASQKDLLTECWTKGGITGSDLDLIEAHGTGTKLGDPIEFGALVDAFGAAPRTDQRCALGSVKSNIGHLLAAAGMASLQKVLMCLEHEKIAPTVHFDRPNEHLSLEESPFRIATEAEAWPRRPGRTRMAGISAFGFSGTNAHVIVAEAPEVTVTNGRSGQWLYPVSAKTKAALKQRIKDLVQFLEGNPSIDPGDLAYTLCLRRQHFRHRSVFAASRLDDLVAAIREEAPSEEDHALASVAQDYLAGGDPDWTALFSVHDFRLVDLPAYPFAKLKSWRPARTEVAGSLASAGQSQTPAVDPKGWSAPELSKRLSDDRGEFFETTFRAEAFYLADHMVGGVGILPGVMAFELAHQLARRLTELDGPIEIRDMVWLRPFEVTKERTARIRVARTPAGSHAFQVMGLQSDGTEILCSQGRIVSAGAAPSAPYDIEEIKKRCPDSHTSSEAYALICRTGIHHGSSLQPIQTVRVGPQEILSTLCLPDSALKTFNDFDLHPSLLDGALQSLVGFAFGRPVGDTYMPFSVGKTILHRPIEKECLVYIRARDADDELKRTYDIVICTPAGEACLEMSGFIHRRMPTKDEARQNDKSDRTVETRIYAPRWIQTPTRGPGLARHAVVIAASDNGEADQITAALSSVIETRRLNVGPAIDADLSDLGPLLASFNGPVAIIDTTAFGQGTRPVAAPHFEVMRALAAIESQNELSFTLLCPSGAPANAGALAALVSTFGQEIPQVTARTVMLKAELSHYVPDQIAEECLAKALSDGELIALDPPGQATVGARTSRRLVTVAPDSRSKSLPDMRGKTVLISGGAGGIAEKLATHAACVWQTNIALIGRRPIDEDIISRLAALRNHGVKAEYASADITDRARLELALTNLRTKLGQFSGVIHSAGVLRDQLIANLDRSAFEEACAPKIDGVENLDAVTKDDPLVFFSTMSSMGALGGNVGQAGYVYGSGFMDALMAARDNLVRCGERSGRSLTVNWPLWDDGGMRVDAETARYLERTVGLFPIPSQTAIPNLEAVLSMEEPQYGVLHGDPAKMDAFFAQQISHQSEAAPFERPAESSTRATDLLALIGEAVGIDPGALSSETELAEIGLDRVRLVWLADEARKRYGIVLDPAALELEQTLSCVLSQGDAIPTAGPGMTNVAQPATTDSLVRIILHSVATTCKLPEDEIEIDEDLTDYGFDSVLMMALTNDLNEQLGIDIPPAEIFANPSIVKLAGFLEENHGPILIEDKTCEPPREEAPSSAPEIVRTDPGPRHQGADGDDIAVIGAWGRYPGAPSLEKFWSNLREGKDSVTRIPDSRWKASDYADALDVPYCHWGGFLEDITGFEPGFFGIAPRDAALIDPQERLFLEAAHGAMEAAGYVGTRLKETFDGHVGVFSGVMWGEYQLYSDPVARNLSSSFSSVSNRVSYAFDLQGPSLAVDTMCSSSLTALHLACEAIKSGQCTAAVAGGVNLSIHPNKYARLARHRFAASDGRCRAFGVGGDGYVPGEGVGTVFLRKLSDAIAADDNILCVIKATAVNHGGRTSGYTVPNAMAQGDVVATAMARSGLNPEELGYLEAHGTGTSLGDPIEIYGLTRAIGDVPPQSIPIGSVKSNIGHLEAAAGIAGLHKVMLQMQAGEIAPSLHSTDLNPEIEFKKTPFQVNQKLRSWSSQSPRIAGVSSFGAGGANAHVIVSEAPERRPIVASGAPYLIVLSARTEASLRALAADLRSWLSDHDGERDLGDVAQTLMVGRSALRIRAAFVCETISEMRTVLAGLSSGDDVPGLRVGRTDPKATHRDPIVQLPLDRAALDGLAEEWVAGRVLNARPDWGQIVSLPTYHFDRERFWFEDSGFDQGGASRAIDTGSLEIEGEFVRKRLLASDPILSDHVIAGKTVVAGAVLLEAARAAAEKLLGQPVHALEAIAWIRPVTIESGQEVELVINLERNADRLNVKVSTGQENSVAMRARIIEQASNSPSQIDIAAIKNRCTTVVDTEALYGAIAERSYGYGPLYRTMRSLVLGDGEALAQVSLAEGYSWLDTEGLVLDPALLDGAFQAISGLARQGNSEGIYLPFQIGGIRTFRPMTSRSAWVHSRRHTAPEDQVQQFDIDIMDENGELFATVEKFFLRRLKPGPDAESRPVARADVSPDTAPETTLYAAEIVESFLIERLHLKSADLTDDLPLVDCGIDSVTLVEFTNLVTEKCGFEPPISALIDLETLGDLVDFIAEEAGIERDKSSRDTHEAADHRPPAQPLETTPAYATSEHSSEQRGNEMTMRSGKVAVIGLSCRLPQSANEQEFWDSLVKERCLVTETPPERWDWRDDFDERKGVPGKTYSRWNGFCHSQGAYDLEFFKVDPRAAPHMDPQQLLMMELTQLLFDNAGYNAKEMAGEDTVVILGAAGKHVELPDHDTKKNLVVVSKIQNMIAARISDFYDLRGTSLTIDTACSSSLVAIHEACAKIISGDAKTAIAGGVTMFTDARANIGFSQAKVLSDDGRCYVFDERAKGIVLGEGAGLVLLKDYDAAVRDGDRIRAVVLGSVVNNDGKTMGLTTPSKDMQRKAICKALDRTGVDPRTIEYLEAHGTGTLLGDPIEIKAATEAFREHTGETGFCGVGSVKSNVGHLLLASGVASFVKVVMSLENRWLPATLFCESPHPRFDFPNTPFVPVQKGRRWEGDQSQRRAAISAFGFGGTNCHMIVEEFCPPADGTAPIRAPLPPTQFNKTLVWPWLGDECLSATVPTTQAGESRKTPVPEPVPARAPAQSNGSSAEAETTKKLLLALREGKISVEDAVKLDQA